MNNVIAHISQINKGILPSINHSEIDTLINEFPCFASAYVLKAIALKNNDVAENFNQELPHIALRIQNRSKLYDLVHQKYFNEISEAENKKLDEEATQLIEQATVLKNEVVIEPKPKNKQKAKQKPKTKNRKQRTVNRKPKTASSESKTENNKPKTTNVKQQTTNNKQLTFTEWLKTKNAEKKQQTANNKPKTANRKQPTKEQIPIDPTAVHEALLHQESKKTSFKLEDFIVDQINKKQQQKTNKKQQTGIGISETYAKILEKQENFEKAIQVYKELSVLYPEKSATFANQIEKLKNKL